jgi:hypothetical protein
MLTQPSLSTLGKVSFTLKGHDLKAAQMFGNRHAAVKANPTNRMHAHISDMTVVVNPNTSKSPGFWLGTLVGGLGMN